MTALIAAGCGSSKEPANSPEHDIRAWVERGEAAAEARDRDARTEPSESVQCVHKDPVHPDRVRSLVAIGGTGKTAVVERFLKKIKKDNKIIKNIKPRNKQTNNDIIIMLLYVCITVNILEFGVYIIGLV